MPSSKGKKRNHTLVSWHLLEKFFSVQGMEVVFHPPHSKQIPKLIRFLKANHSNLKQSFYHRYLKREFFLEKVALRDRWKTHCLKKPIISGLVEEKNSGKIITFLSGSRESHLPLFISHIVVVDEKFRMTNLFEQCFFLMHDILEKSGIEHAICSSSVLSFAPQKVFLKAGMSVCGIDPAGETMKIDGKEKYVPDVYFHKFLGKGKDKILSEENYQLTSEAKTLWDTLKKL